VKRNFTVLIVVLNLMAVGDIIAAERDELKNIRTFISLLDYISTDYENAVEDDKVINANEYLEMNEFINKAIDLFDKSEVKIDSAERIDVSRELEKLKSFIENKDSKEEVYNKSVKIRASILKYNLIETAPINWPDIQNGEKLFRANCSSCHGVKGNGEGKLSKTLIPKPANFLNDTLMDKISPFNIYNTVRLGINGTSMVPFTHLSDKEVWDVSFYISSLRYEGRYKLPKDSLLVLFDKAYSNTSLEEISTLSDNLLIAKIGGNIKADTLKLATLRLYKIQSDHRPSINIASTYLDDVLSLYQKNEYEKAEDKALFAYLEGVEPFEGQLRAINSELLSELESVMYKLRKDIKKLKPLEIINNDIERAQALISDASSAMETKSYSFGFVFILAASIILREGIEAFLIIITILGVLKSINESKAVNWVHGGWIFALLLGIASMFFVRLIVSFNAQSREVMEGAIAIFAVILLLYVGFWLHSKTEAKKWKEFVENNIIKLVSSKNMIGLAAISFVVVIREAFESVIFLSAIELQVDQGAKSGIYFGAVSSLILVLFLAWIALKFAVKLPVIKLFKYSAFTIVVLSIILAGKGIQAFQESGYVSITQMPIKFALPLLGFYPTIETTIAQTIIFLFTIFLWNINKDIPKKKLVGS